MITLTTSQVIFITIGVSTTVNTLCKFLFMLDTPRRSRSHTTNRHNHHTTNH